MTVEIRFYFYFIYVCIVSLLGLNFKPVVADMAETLSEFFPDVENDLTIITWAHAVNSKALLKETLSGNKMMIEGDVLIGHLEGDSGKTPIPIMAHPPATISDLSLKEFLNLIVASQVGKGVKLDFKTKEAFQAAEAILEEFYLKSNVDFPLWLNADIIPGPVNSHVKPVDADYFLSTCVNKFPLATISAGWTTRYGGDIETGSYSPDYVANMTEALNRNSVVQPVTFAVRAGLAAQSYQSLCNLIGSSIPGTTLTIWNSSNKDRVNINDLRKLIDDIGKDKIYLDLPDDMTNKLRSHANRVFGKVIPLMLLLGTMHLIL